MEIEVFGGLEEIFKGKEKEKFDSFLNVHQVNVLENIVLDQTVANSNNVVSPDLQEQATDDLDEDLDEVMESFKKKIQESDEQIHAQINVVSPDLQEQATSDLDEDLDEVMENFIKKSQESDEHIDEEINDLDDLEDEALTVEALMKLEKPVVPDGRNEDEDDDVMKEQEQEVKEVHLESFPGNEHVGGHFWRSQPMHHQGLLHNLGSNYSRYQNYRQYNSWNSRNMMNYSVYGRVTNHYNSWNARNMNYGVSTRVTNYPTSWSEYYTSTYLDTRGGVRGRSSLLPPLSSSSSSSTSLNDDYNRPKLLLGGHIDISFLKSSIPSSSSNGTLHGNRYSSFPSWNNNATLGNSCYSPHYASLDVLPRGESSSSFYGGGCGDGVVGLSSQHSQPNKYCHMLNKVSNSSKKVAPKKIKRKREVKEELPPDWKAVGRPRKNGKSRGQIDKYYINIKTKQRVRSMIQLRRYLRSQANKKSEV